MTRRSDRWQRAGAWTRRQARRVVAGVAYRIWLRARLAPPVVPEPIPEPEPDVQAGRHSDDVSEVPADPDHVGSLVQIEFPPPGIDVYPGFVELSGIACTLPQASHITVTVDGQPVGSARLHSGPSPIHSDPSMPGSPLSVFSFPLDLREVPFGSVLNVGCTVDLLGGASGSNDGSGHKPIESEPIEVRMAKGPRPESQGSLPGWSVADVVWPASERTTDALRLVVFAHDLDIGGAQLYLQELLRRLLADAAVSCLVIAPGDGSLRAGLEAMGATVHITGRYPIESPVAYEAKLAELALVMRDHNANAALANTIISGPGADLATRLGLPTVWAVHEGVEFDEFFHAAFAETWHTNVHDNIRNALAFASAVVFVADATRDLYRTLGDPRRFVTVPYGIDLDEVDRYRRSVTRSELRAEHDIDGGAFVVVCVGNFEARKAQALLALAFAEHAESHPEAVLILVGHNGSDYAIGVDEVVTNLDLGAQIRTVALDDHPYRWLALADGFALASDLESMPRSIIEAMAFELPVLATDVAGVSNLVRDGETGYLCRPRDLDELVRSLGRLLSDPPEKHRMMGLAGRQLVLREHDGSYYAAVFRRLFDALLETPGVLPGDVLAVPGEPIIGTGPPGTGPVGSGSDGAGHPVDDDRHQELLE